MSGNISIGEENTNNKSFVEKDTVDNNQILKNNNKLKVESQLIYAEEIIKSITLQ